MFKLLQGQIPNSIVVSASAFTFSVELCLDVELDQLGGIQINILI